MFSSKSLTVENELAVQAGTSCRESTKAYLIQNFILKVPIFRFPRQKCCKLSFLRQKGCFKHSCMSCDRPILEAVWAKNWMIHPATKLGQGAGPGIVHCCTMSLCYLGAETDDHYRNPNINTEII